MLVQTLLIVFFIGYLAIILEHKTGINKAGSALLLAVACWIINFIWAFPNEASAMARMNEHLGGISQVVFYVLGAMVIVGLIEVHNGFQVITQQLRHIHDKKFFLVVVTFFTFFLSAILDNMTTVIVMTALIRPLLDEKNDRLMFVSMVVIAANAGGAWSPIGDVTTTMLWIDNKVSSLRLIQHLFGPSVLATLIPLLFFLPSVRGVIRHSEHHPQKSDNEPAWVLALGLGVLIFVPVLRAMTGVPPYMGIMMGMGLMWMFTDLVHREHHSLRVPHVLTRIDISSVLFFLGILLAVAALDSINVFRVTADWLNHTFANQSLIIAILGLLSAVFDNVPLTASVINMYNLPQFPLDAMLWHLTAYCVGTGGSILIIGSAAGIVAMGAEGVTFGWYFRRVSWPAFLGYVAGLTLMVW